MTSMRVELRHLRIILEIAESGSIRKAACAMCIAQPALVGQLHRIEQALGGQLFTRTRTGIIPTELGRYVIGAGQDLLRGFDGLIAETIALAGRRDGPASIRVGGVPIAPMGALTAGVAAVLPQWMTSTKEVHWVSHAAELLAAGELDVALLYEFPALPLTLPPRVRTRDVVSIEPAFLGLRADHRLAGRDEVELGDLAGEDWIVGAESDGSGREAMFQRACLRAGFTPTVRHDARGCETVFALLQRGGAVAMVHPLCVPPEDVVLRPLAGTPQYRSIKLCWQADSPVDEVAPALHRALVDAYHSEVALRAGYRTWWLDNIGALAAQPPRGTPVPQPCVPAARLPIVASAS